MSSNCSSDTVFVIISAMLFPKFRKLARSVKYASREWSPMMVSCGDVVGPM